MGEDGRVVGGGGLAGQSGVSVEWCEGRDHNAAQYGFCAKLGSKPVSSFKKIQDTGYSDLTGAASAKGGRDKTESYEKQHSGVYFYPVFEQWTRNLQQFRRTFVTLNDAVLLHWNHLFDVFICLVMEIKHLNEEILAKGKTHTVLSILKCDSHSYLHSILNERFMCWEGDVPMSTNQKVLHV